MQASSLSSLFRDDPRTAEILAYLEKPGSGIRLAEDPDKARINLKGLIGSARSLVSAAVFERSSALHCFILPDKETAAYFFNDLEQIFSEKDKETEKRKVLFFPSSFKKHSPDSQKDNMGLLSRTEVLNRLHSHAKKFIIVTYPEAVSEKVVNRKFLEKNTLKLRSGEAVSPDFILDLLIEYEFERADFVIEPGQFSLRGGLIDVYSFSGEHPYRIEFEGDKVASIRTFDASSQLSIEKKSEITILPDIRVDKGKRIKFDAIFEFFPEQSVIWTDDFASLAAGSEQTDDPDYFIPGTGLAGYLEKFNIVEFGKQFRFRNTAQVLYQHAPQPVFHKNFDLLFSNLLENTANGTRNILLAANEKQSERLESILADLKSKNNLQQPLDYSIVRYPLHEGFIERTLHFAFYTDHQIFERYQRFHLRDGYASREALTLKELYDLTPGDYVTHIDHGVGRFDGLEKIVNNGREQEAIRLIYKNSDTLYVSIHSLHRISKYIGKEGNPPVLNRLGSDAWTKLKNRTKNKVKDIAKDLIRLYAERRATKGFACSPDTYLQTELEASFMYEDTPDQLKATVDVKKDLEAEFPMDRLICGDVGFGKTEIAIRAAFKMVAESRQVAILVPTTILALQHYKTFSDRLSDFPCTVNYINRFKSARAQKKILSELESGKIDILIGTHRVLSKDIKFRDLGLLIIDEEQKFGVAAKERIKRFRINVDTLTLTATPIPRTLQFSLMGARDLSIINTPPPNRYPVQTEIHPFNEEIIRDAILYEVSRGGQVFFVNSRVQNILEVAGMIQRTVPGVKIAVAHGQMEGAKLENVMVDFIEGDYDVLVATTIIESGLDIPNVNTIIINDAQSYGLSDLHQLRGRVGRSNKRAFCYLLAPSLTALSGEARKRLQAIEEFSELGSGFNIAMRDLDIRGAGNILGAEQSGFISEIGFDMYQKILDEAILELKEQEFKDLFHEEHPVEFVRDCTIETDLEILIPDDYITNIAERLSLYKELDSLNREEDLVSYRERLIDRFGPLPDQTEALIQTIRLRWIAKKLCFEKLVLRNDRLLAFFPSSQDSPYYQSEKFTAMLNFLRDHPEFSRMKEMNGKLSLTISKVKSIHEAINSLLKISSVIFEN